MPKPNPTPNCKHCGTTFQKQHKRAVYCSLDCAIDRGIARTGESECWLWGGAVNSNGYGQITFDSKRYYVHRIACERVHGPLGGLDVLHTCDTPRCCNPNHLTPGTAAENMADMARKGRQGVRKLNEADVRAIRALHHNRPIGDIAEEFHVCRATVEAVIYGRYWRHV